MLACPFCHSEGGDIIWQDALCRVVFANEPDYPGFCRVIAHQHVKEMTDLASSTQLHIMRVILTVERMMRETLRPDKVNLASLGNHVPHVHWHIIPRYHNDPHFPEPIWATAQIDRQPQKQSLQTLDAFTMRVQQALLALK